MRNISQGARFLQKTFLKNSVDKQVKFLEFACVADVKMMLPQNTAISFISVPCCTENVSSVVKGAETLWEFNRLTHYTTAFQTSKRNKQTLM